MEDESSKTPEIKAQIQTSKEVQKERYLSLKEDVIFNNIKYLRINDSYESFIVISECRECPFYNDFKDDEYPSKNSYWCNIFIINNLYFGHIDTAVDFNSEEELNNYFKTSCKLSNLTLNILLDLDLNNFKDCEWFINLLAKGIIKQNNN
jgi:hypothetical protein